MARFSIGEAIGAGFRLIGRRPLTVFIWGLLVVLPTVAGFVLILPAMDQMIAAQTAAETTGQEPPVGPMLAQMLQMQLASGLMNIVQLLALLVVYTAVMRAVIRPEESRWFSLRVGMDEIRVAVVGIATFGGLYIAVVVVTLIIIGIGFTAFAFDRTVGGVVVGLLAVILVIAFWVAMIRLCLMAPASVLRREFAFAEGWRLGKGQLGPLFGMSVLIMLIIWAIEIVIVLALFAILTPVFAGAAASGADWGADPSFNPFAEAWTWLKANWYWGVAGVLAVSAAYGALIAISTAPFASACRQLAGASKAEETF